MPGLSKELIRRSNFPSLIHKVKIEMLHTEERASMLPCQIWDAEESLDCLILHVAWLHLMVSKSLPLSLKYPFCCLRSWNVLMRPPCFASVCFDHHWQSYTTCSCMLLYHVYTVINSWVLWMENARASQTQTDSWRGTEIINYPMYIMTTDVSSRI